MPPPCTKASLLYNLKNRVFARIKRSPVHGIGVFAIRDIPKGIDPFQKPEGSEDESRVIKVSLADVAGVDESVVAYLNDFILFKNGVYHLPDFGLNGLDIAWFMNHSANPNVMFAGQDFDETLTMRNISAGEELVIDYRMYSNNPNDSKFVNR